MSKHAKRSKLSRSDKPCRPGRQAAQADGPGKPSKPGRPGQMGKAGQAGQAGHAPPRHYTCAGVSLHKSYVTLHLCTFQRSRIGKHCTHAGSSAQAAFGVPQRSLSGLPGYSSSGTRNGYRGSPGTHQVAYGMVRHLISESHCQGPAERPIGAPRVLIKWRTEWYVT